MDTKDQITHCATQIEKLNTEWSYREMRALLRDLDRSSVTVALLQATDIVKILYRVLKTCSDAHVKRLIKGILSKWKKQYSQSYKNDPLPPRDCVASQSLVSDATGQADSELDSPQTDSPPGRPSEGRGGGWPHAEDKMLTPMTDSPHQPPSENTPPTSTPEDTGKPSGDFPDVRSKSLQLLLAALRSQGPPDRSKEEEDERLAGDLEHHIYSLHAASQLKYKACVRSKVANLRNPRSGHLRRGLLDRSLLPGEFARMTPEEMAGPDLRRLRREYTARAVSEHQLPRAPEGTPTQKVRCRRCEASDCRVSQVSRGALFLPGWVKPGGPDHDGVTFVTCSVCGEQWYHSGWVCL
ncbi:unnamed protein product [Lota lota]